MESMARGGRTPAPGRRASVWLRVALGRLGVVLAMVWLAAPVHAHPAPFSYLDLRLDADGLTGSLVVHAIDVAYELDIESPGALMDEAFAAARRDRIFDIVLSRFSVRLDGRDVSARRAGITVLADRQALRLGFAFAPAPFPATLHVSAHLFPYDPNHQTFVNVYESGVLVNQAILSQRRTTIEHFTGTRQGTRAVVQRFVASGIHHIMIGPDHILFLIGLLLLGGGMWPLLKIVTAFTVAHSVTLSLAALGLVTPSVQLIEPAIALSIVYVGADNLLVAKYGRDVRAWVALGFGLIHGFGFASVLGELDLPRQALGWSLFSFNLGVEIGQVCIVLVVASTLAAVRRRHAAWDRRIVVLGSTGVIAAGVFWFVERVFLTGG